MARGRRERPCPVVKRASGCLRDPARLRRGCHGRALSPPPALQEENSLFIMTNMIVTTNQTQGHCPEVGSFSGRAPAQPTAHGAGPRGTRFLSSFLFPDSRGDQCVRVRRQVCRRLHGNPQQRYDCTVAGCRPVRLLRWRNLRANRSPTAPQTFT